MHKLVILFETPLNWPEFESSWQTFVGLAEKMPGLLAETVSNVQGRPFDLHKRNIVRIHEFYFTDRAALDDAMQSPAGQKAGNWLHTFTGGRITLLIAKHMEATAKDFTKPSQSS